ncbi:class I SAM-dependent methyltransferase [Edaphobacter aggregans]|uniref:class I SAM-dependent methyltransferase n=1 Tax=Edaphobacter aggregans TaxID=570835 RepID=UPI00054E8013|nr:class I SAM-dependent methyltransferase [Edaphobacter aggregans]
MSDHTERFSGRVADYERYRSRYPAQVIDVLVERCGLTLEHLVADIGAGTGMLAELFLQHGNAVVAVEPNDEMRAACERLAAAWPGLTVKEGTAEQTGLENASVDFITVGRAFHWFDLERTRPEFQRILKPGGWVVLVNNSRVRDDSPISQDYEAVLREHGIDYAANRERYEIAPKVDAFFVSGELFRREISGEQRLTLEELVGLTQSYSVTPSPDHPKYEGMQKALQEFFAQRQKDEVVTIRTLCRIACGRFAPASTR